MGIKAVSHVDGWDVTALLAQYPDQHWELLVQSTPLHLSEFAILLVEHDCARWNNTAFINNKKLLNEFFISLQCSK